MAKHKTQLWRETILVNKNCGCCYDELSFNTIYSAKEAFKKAGIGLNQVVKDSDENAYLFLDTRCFWSLEKTKNSAYWKYHDMEESGKELELPF